MMTRPFLTAASLSKPARLLQSVRVAHRPLGREVDLRIGGDELLGRVGDVAGLRHDVLAAGQHQQLVDERAGSHGEERVLPDLDERSDRGSAGDSRPDRFDVGLHAGHELSRPARWRR